jgi:hypothetical protein
MKSGKVEDGGGRVRGRERERERERERAALYYKTQILYIDFRALAAVLYSVQLNRSPLIIPR